MHTKQTAKITDYMVVRDVNKKPLYLLGHVSEHPRQEQFEQQFQRTSSIINLDEAAGFCETENTMYTLDGEAISSSDLCAIFPY